MNSFAHLALLDTLLKHQPSQLKQPADNQVTLLGFASALLAKYASSTRVVGVLGLESMPYVSVPGYLGPLLPQHRIGLSKKSKKIYQELCKRIHKQVCQVSKNYLNCSGQMPQFWMPRWSDGRCVMMDRNHCVSLKVVSI